MEGRDGRRAGAAKLAGEAPWNQSWNGREPGELGDGVMSNRHCVSGTRGGNHTADLQPGRIASRLEMYRRKRARRSA